jgi:hypothetical protein
MSRITEILQPWKERRVNIATVEHDILAYVSGCIGNDVDPNQFRDGTEGRWGAIACNALRADIRRQLGIEGDKA